MGIWWARPVEIAVRNYCSGLLWAVQKTGILHKGIRYRKQIWVWVTNIGPLYCLWPCLTTPWSRRTTKIRVPAPKLRVRCDMASYLEAMVDEEIKEEAIKKDLGGKRTRGWVTTREKIGEKREKKKFKEPESLEADAKNWKKRECRGGKKKFDCNFERGSGTSVRTDVHFKFPKKKKKKKVLFFALERKGEVWNEDLKAWRREQMLWRSLGFKAFLYFYAMMAGEKKGRLDGFYSVTRGCR